METTIQYILDNKEWIFSGIGVFIIGLFVAYLKHRSTYRKAINQKIKKVSNSSVIQLGEMNVNNEKE